MKSLIMSVLVAMAAAVAPVAGSCQTYGFGQSGEHVLSVSGVGTVLVDPDHGMLEFEIQGSAASVDEAKEQTDRIAGSFVARIEDMGVDSRDIRSDPMTIRRSTDRDGREFINYQRRTSVILRDLDLFEGVEAAALECGITNIGQIEYSHSELDQLQDEALSLAFDDAREQARQTVEALDLQLGRIISVSVGQRARLSPVDLEFIPTAFTSSPANRRTGQLQITRSVALSYRLVE
jgi:uncharacterized protein YggE